MVIQLRTAVYALLVLGLAASSAYCQTATEPKLMVAAINLNSPTPDGFYNAGVNVILQRGGNNPQVGFNLSFQHIRTLDELYAKLKPAVDQLADELKIASEHFQPPH